MELVLGLQPVGPPERVHVEVELGRDAHQGVAGLDLVDLDLILDAVGGVVDDDRLEERAVGGVGRGIRLVADRCLDDRFLAHGGGGLEVCVAARGDIGAGRTVALGGHVALARGALHRRATRHRR